MKKTSDEIQVQKKFENENGDTSRLPEEIPPPPPPPPPPPLTRIHPPIPSLPMQFNFPYDRPPMPYHRFPFFPNPLSYFGFDQHVPFPPPNLPTRLLLYGPTPLNKSYYTLPDNTTVSELKICYRKPPPMPFYHRLPTNPTSPNVGANGVDGNLPTNETPRFPPTSIPETVRNGAGVIVKTEPATANECESTSTSAITVEYTDEETIVLDECTVDSEVAERKPLPTSGATSAVAQSQIIPRTKQVFNNENRPQRSRSYLLQSLTIGEFTMTTPERFYKNKLRLVFGLRQMLYDFEYQHFDPRVQKTVTVTALIIVSLDNIVSIFIENKSVTFRLSEPAKIVTAVDRKSLPKSFRTKSIGQTTIDITNGNVYRVLQHKITLTRSYGEILKRCFTEYNPLLKFRIIDNSFGIMRSAHTSPRSTIKVETVDTDIKPVIGNFRSVSNDLKSKVNRNSQTARVGSTNVVPTELRAKYPNLVVLSDDEEENVIADV